MSTRLIIFFRNSAVTLTSKFQGQMINCLCLKNAGPDLHETNAVWINWLIYFIYDLGHWPYLWPWSWISNVKSWNAIATKYLTWSQKIKKGELFGWFDIFVNNIWLTFCFHLMLQCRSSVTFLSLATSVWSYFYSTGDGVYLVHTTCWGAVLGFTPYTHRSGMKFPIFYVTGTQIWCKLWSNLLRLLTNIWNSDRLMEGWTDGEYTMWLRAKVELCRRIQYYISIQQRITLKIGTK